MNKEHDLFQHFAQEQMIYMWNVLTAIFFTPVLMVIGYCAALACFPDFWWTSTLCFGIPFAYIAIQNIYIDHDVMHGATFPVYEWQRFLTHPFAEGKYDIFVTQESHLWGRSLTSWHQKALKLGFRSWALPVEVTNNAVGARQVHGGLAVLVKSTLKASLVQQVRDDNGEMQALASGDRLFLNLWHRPHKAHIGMYETIAALTEQFPLFGAMGDWNVLPNQCPVKSLENVQVVAAVDSSGLLPTRWESTRCIDYAVFRGGQCTEAAILEDKVSDHKAVAFTFDGFGNPHSSEHFLKPKMLYKCPTSLDMDGWKKALKSAYFPFHRGSVDFTNQAQVDECWWRFNRHVEGAFNKLHEITTLIRCEQKGVSRKDGRCRPRLSATSV